MCILDINNWPFPPPNSFRIGDTCRRARVFSSSWIKTCTFHYILVHSKHYSKFLDLPPPPDPPPGQGLRQQIGPSQHAGNVENSTERKGSSLDRQQASNLEDTKSSLDCPAKTSLEWQRQTQEWINSTERQEDIRKALHKQGVGPGVFCTVPRKCGLLLFFFYQVSWKCQLFKGIWNAFALNH